MSLARSREPDGATMDRQVFHREHEEFTERAYQTPGLLPDRYVFVLTNLCNLDCHFCFQERTPRKGSMTTDDWLALASQLPSYARVTLTGGEPLVFKGFKQIFAHIAERFDCNMITNGLLLTPEIIDFLLSYRRFRVLSVSIDNIGNTLRDVKPDKWAHVEEMMRHFVTKRDHVHSDCVMDAKTVVLDENAEELLAIHRYCVEDLNCDHHSFQFLKGSPTQHADYMFPFEAILQKSSAPTYRKFDVILKQLELVRQYNVETGKVAFLHPSACSLTSHEPVPDLAYVNRADHVRGDYLPCKFPWSSVHINVDGAVFPCMAVAMGNVKDTPLADIIRGPAYEEFRGLIRREGTVEGCNRCGWLRPNHAALAKPL